MNFHNFSHLDFTSTFWGLFESKVLFDILELITFGFKTFRKCIRLFCSYDAICFLGLFYIWQNEVNMYDLQTSVSQPKSLRDPFFTTTCNFWVAEEK